jgi:hypothetical protein
MLTRLTSIAFSLSFYTTFCHPDPALRLLYLLDNDVTRVVLTQPLQSTPIWQVKCPGRNTWFTGPAIAVTRWYVVHLMIPGTWSTVANLIDDFFRALTLADGKLSSQNPPWRQVLIFFLFMDFFALSSHTHYVLREFENKHECRSSSQ